MSKYLITSSDNAIKAESTQVHSKGSSLPACLENVLFKMVGLLRLRRKCHSRSSLLLTKQSSHTNLVSNKFMTTSSLLF